MLRLIHQIYGHNLSFIIKVLGVFAGESELVFQIDLTQL